MVRAIGIDPGTISFDLCGIEGDHVFLDETIPTERISSHPQLLVDRLQQGGPVDMIIGPSGYGLPWVSAEELDEEDRALVLLSRKQENGRSTVIEGLGSALSLLKKTELPIYFAPAVIHLPTVPPHRKVNRIDMGTSDKVCAVALGVWDQGRRLDIPYRDTSFLYVELGGAFTAIIAVDGGTIVDGTGGTSGSLGYLASGAMDGEVAYLLGEFPKGTLSTGGLAYTAGAPSASPKQLISRLGTDPQCTLAWEAFLESLVKGVASLMTVVPSPREVLLSGRLSRVSAIRRRVKESLERFAPVRRVHGFANGAKEAAQGAALIGEGLAGGRSKSLVEAMQIREAAGTALDHLYVVGSETLREQYRSSQA